MVIADDSDAYRSGMVRAIRAHDALELVGEVDGGVAARIERAREVGADAYLSKAASRREICDAAIRVGRSVE